VAAGKSPQLGSSPALAGNLLGVAIARALSQGLKARWRPDGAEIAMIVGLTALFVSLITLAMLFAR